eukprot:g1401.t1
MTTIMAASDDEENASAAGNSCSTLDFEFLETPTGKSRTERKVSKQKKEKKKKRRLKTKQFSASSAESPLRKIALRAKAKAKRHAESPLPARARIKAAHLSGFSLRSAVIDGDLELMDKILTKCPELLSDVMEAGEHGSNEAGLTALHVACMMGLPQCIEVLMLHAGPHHPMLNMKSELSNTPLHYACAGGHAVAVQLLVEAGCDVYAKDLLGQTAQDVAQLSCLRDWATCVQLIEAEKVRFGKKVLKRAGGIIAAIALGALGWYWLTTESKTDDEKVM